MVRKHDETSHSTGGKRWISPVRKAVQAAWALFCVYTGWQFYNFYTWAMGTSEALVPRPPAVEAFLPISALMSLKRLLITGEWDNIHPAGLTFFIAVIAVSFLFRRGFCGWVCPVGLLSDLTEKAGSLLKIRLNMPLWLHYPLLSLKYLLLGFFAWIILVKMDTQSIASFLQSPYNITVDARMLLFFLDPSSLALGVMAALILISIIFKHAWCTYLCPYGALLGIISFISPLYVKRDSTKCIQCKKCQKSCPASIKVWDKESVTVPECIGCLECISSCPEDECLSLNIPGLPFSIPAWTVPVGIAAVIIGAWLLAQATGHWHSRIPDETFKYLYNRFLSGA